VDQIHHRCLVAAGLRRRGDGVMAGIARELRRGHGLGAVAGGSRVLAGGFRAFAEADVDLCIRPRVDACALDVVVRRAGQEDEGHIQRRACYSFENQLRDCAGAVFFPVVRDHGRRHICHRPFDLGLAELSGVVSPVRRRGLCVSRHIDMARLENAPDGHYVAGLSVFGSNYFSGQRGRAIVRRSIADGKGQLCECIELVAGQHRRYFAPACAMV